MCGGIEKTGCDVIAKSEMEQLIKIESKLIKSNAKDRDTGFIPPLRKLNPNVNLDHLSLSY